MSPDALRYGRIGPRRLLSENPWFIEPNVNEEREVWGNVLRSLLRKLRTQARQLPVVNHCKQSKLPQTKAKYIENVKFNEGTAWSRKRNISKEGKTMFYGILKEQRV